VKEQFVDLSAEPSDELKEFAVTALDHATSSVVPRGGPLVPFAMTHGAAGRQLTRFEGDMVEAQDAARQLVRESPGLTLAAVAWDGYLTVDGHRTDAVFVDACDASGQPGVLLAQPYREVGRFRRRAQVVGEVVFVEEREPLF
jgi:hypothetical protein